MLFLGKYRKKSVSAIDFLNDLNVLIKEVNYLNYKIIHWFENDIENNYMILRVLNGNFSKF